MRSSTLLNVACCCLGLAVLTGVVESAVSVIGALSVAGSSAGLALQVSIRAVLYGVALVLIVLAWRQSRVARWALLILLGVIGTGSMIIPMIGELASGESLGRALGGDVSPLFPGLRVSHIGLVVFGSLALLRHRPQTSDALTRVV